MIIGHDLMVQLGLVTKFKRQVLQWDSATLPTKEPRGLLGKLYLNKRKMREVVTHTAEPDSTREATERLVKIPDSTYSKADLKYVSNNATHINTEERTQLLRQDK